MRNLGLCAKWLAVSLAALHPCAQLSAQIAGLNLTSAATSPGGTLDLSLSLSAAGSLPAALEWTLAYPPSQVSAITVTAGPTAVAAGKTLYCLPSDGLLSCLLIGFNASGSNSNTMASGVAAVVHLTLAPNAGTMAIAIANPSAADPTGVGLAVSGGPGAVVTVPGISSLACNPATLHPGAIGSCAVTLNAAAPAGGISVLLSSTNALLTVPASATVASGTTTAAFSATAAAGIASNQNATITAALGGSTRTAVLGLSATGGSGTGTGPLTASPASVTLSLPANVPGTQPVTLIYQSTTRSAPAFQATAATSGSTPWLTASPASGLMTQTSFDGATYTYTATVTIGANPTGFTPGSTLSGAVNYTAANGTASTPVTLNVTGPAAFTVAPQSLSFSYTQGASSPPAAQNISVFSTSSGGQVAARAVMNNGESWLTVSGGGATPASLSASVNPNLAPGTYTATIAISAGAGTVNVPVSYSVVNLPPQLSVLPLTETFTLTQGTSPASGLLTVSNAGGGTLRFTAQVAGNRGTWLTLTGNGSGSATPTAPALLGFTADPTGLSPGLYTGQITVQDADSSAQTVVNIMLAVSQAPQLFAPSQSGLTFSAIAGGQTPPPQSFTVSGQGSASLSWTAQPQTISNPLAPSANWLSVNSQAGSPVAVSVNPGGLPAGQYYGSVNIAAPDAANSPQSVLVLLNVTSPGNSATNIGFSTGGVILSGRAGRATPQAQQISLFNPSSATVNYSTAVSTSNGIAWLSASPASGPLLPAGTSVSIVADLSALPPGVQTGAITFGFDNGTVGVLQVAVVATGEPAAVITGNALRAQALTPSGACPGGTPGYLIPFFRQPLSASVLQAGLPQRVQLQVTDDCGHALTAANGGATQVSFGNQDAPIKLADVGGGIWEGTWTPVNAATTVALQAFSSARSPALNSIAASLAVTAQPASLNVPAQVSTVMNAASASQAMPQIVTPGGYVVVYGTNLASTSGPAGTIPLPTTLNGTELFLGGQPLPLLYAGPGQVNALIPRSLNPNTSYQLVVQRGPTLSVPQPLTIAEFQPGIYTLDLSGAGQGIVEIAGTTLLAAATGNGSRPVERGSEFLLVLATGLGPVIGSSGAAPPPDGAATPLTAIYQTTATVTATLGGVDVPVSFAGLTPALVGIYQINVQVPATAPAGDAVPLVLTLTDPATGQSVQSNTVTIAVQ